MTFNPAQEKFPLRQKSWLQKSNLLAQNVHKAVTGEHDTPRLGVRYSPESGHSTGRAGCPLWVKKQMWRPPTLESGHGSAGAGCSLTANSEHERYSITSSARPSNNLGTFRLSSGERPLHVRWPPSSSAYRLGLGTLPL